MLRKLASHTDRGHGKAYPAPDKPSNGHQAGLLITKAYDKSSRGPLVKFPSPIASSVGDGPNQQNGPRQFRGPSHSDSILPSLEHIFAQSSLSDPDPLGLHLIHNHPEPRGDVVFVHGLGGTAVRTWSWERNIHNFWPIWLAEEDEFSEHRIFTYGYNSNFMGNGTTLNIIDFAKDLLVQLLVHSHGAREEKKTFGQRPVIFVVHSMGGLVVKKAFVLGKNDNRYSHIVSRTRGIMFLGTPHRGTHYAKTLNSILSSSPIGGPPKAYVDDLDVHSRSIQDINEQFRISCGDLSLVSLYETSKTSFGLKKTIVVEKESATLGYPQELSSPLNADHHNICKFKNKHDPNYRIVASILKLWAPQRPSLQAHHASSTSGVPVTVEAIMGIRDRPEDEFENLRRKAMTGTCDWITEREDFFQWLDTTRRSQSPSIFWLIGLPAMGKSVLASYVAEYVRTRISDKSCQFHFFSANHQNKRTIAHSLRSIASQLALANGEFREKLLFLHQETGISFNSQNQNFSVIWEKIFEDIIFKLKTKPMYFILDALDEADDPTHLINSLVKIQSLTQIRIFMTSRPMRIPSGLAAGDTQIQTCFLSEGDTRADIHAYVNNVVNEALPNTQMKLRNDLVRQVVAKAEGSFLWVRLALESLRENWHTQEDIQKALTEMPSGMKNLYVRMLEKITTQSSRIQLIAERILTWITLSWRPLAITELQTALKPEFSDFVNLADTITQICGNFLSVDNNRVSLVHMTARQFLLEGQQGLSPFIDSGHGHEYVATICLRYLSDEKWKRTFKGIEASPASGSRNRLARKPNRLLVAEKSSPLLGYAVCYFAYHVSRSYLDSRTMPHNLNTFFSQYCLYWIEAIALSTELRYLTRSARYLKTYAKRLSHRPKNNLQDLLRDTNSDDSQCIRSWANDFIRIVGKFGSNLVQSPSSIHQLIPAFCPTESMIGAVYGILDRPISLTGLRSEVWDDCLACLPLGSDEGGTKILATDAFFLTLLGGSSTVIVWDAETYEIVQKLEHDGYVSSISLSRSQNLLVIAGPQTYRIWDISSGKEAYRLNKKSHAATVSAILGKLDDELIVGLDDCSLTCYDLIQSQPKWRFTPPRLEDYDGCPLIVTLSPCLTKVAMAWRGKPPIVWDVFGGNEQQPLRCPIQRSADPVVSPLAMQWQIDSNSILILCQNTTLKEWHIFDEDLRDFSHVQAQEIQLSQDGTFLLTSDYMGAINIYTFPGLSLIYQLMNKNEFVESLAFSPDAQRFYELRDTVCNVWEPDALIRPNDIEIEDHGSSIMTESVVAHDESCQVRITALTNGFGDKFYCIGKEDGTVCIHDSITGNQFRKVSVHSSQSSIITLSWSPSGRFLISGDDSGRLLAKRLDQKQDGTFAVFPVFDTRTPEPVRHFVFSTTERQLLISTTSTDRIWDLKTKTETCSRARGPDNGSRWTQHPFQPELLMAIFPSSIQNHTWDGLQPTNGPMNFPEEPFSPTKSTGHGNTVHWVAQTSDKQYLIYLSRTGSSHKRLASGAHLEILELSKLKAQQSQSLTEECLCEVAKQVKYIMGTYHDHLAFLDHDYWLCTWKIEATFKSNVKRHYFLPRDWLNPSTLHMATLSPQGTLFCPKLGHVAVVKNGIRL